MSKDVPASWFSMLPPRNGAESWLGQEHATTSLEPAVIGARIKRLHTALNGAAPPMPDTGSEMDLDDRALDPYHLSHAMLTATGIALDHLEAFRSLLEDARRTHPWAHHTLLRSAVENAATAVWLAAPQDAADRRFRRLKLADTDAVESGRAREIHGLTPPSGRSIDEIRADIAARSPDARDPRAGHLSFRSIVRAGASAAGLSADTVELLWRVESGLAHGRTWASISMLKSATRPSAVDDVQTVRMSVTPQQLMPAAATALHLVQHGRALWDARSSAQSAAK